MYIKFSIVNPIKGNVHACVQSFRAVVLNWNNNLDKAAEVDGALHLVLQLISSELQLEAVAVFGDHGADRWECHYQLFEELLVIFLVFLLLETSMYFCQVQDRNAIHSLSGHVL